MMIFKGLSGAILSRSNDAMIYMEGASFLILIILSLYGIIDAVKDINTKKDSNHKKLKLGAILLSGIYPCPAAMLVLVLAVSLNLLALGIFAVIAMSVGMSIPIIASGYLAWAGRTGLLQIKGKRKNYSPDRFYPSNRSLRLFTLHFGKNGLAFYSKFV
nr:hypothetical protein [Treponema denticola]